MASSATADDPFAAALSAAAELARHGVGFPTMEQVQIMAAANANTPTLVATNIPMQVSSVSPVFAPTSENRKKYESDDDDNEDDDVDDEDSDSKDGEDAERRIKRSRERNREHAKKTRVSGDESNLQNEH
jgi:hypothetical protein